MVVADFLSEVEFFKVLPRDVLEKIGPRMEKKDFAAGDRLISSAERGGYMYLIFAGSVRLKFDERPLEESPALIVHKGDVFGLVSLLSDNGKVDIAVARENTTIFRLSKAVLFEHLALFVQLRQSLSRYLMRVFSFEPTLIFMKTAGQYENTQEIARSKTNVYYKTKLFKQNQFLAIRMIPFEQALDPKFTQRLEADIDAIIKLRHKHIASITAFEKNYGTYFLYSEFVSGESLQGLMMRRKLTLRESQQIIRQTAEALAFAHGRKMLHRNLSADKIMISSASAVKILDFGVGYSEIIDGPFGTVLLEGNAACISPEQVRAEEPSAKSDIYSFGVICFQMLTGQLPFPGKNAYDLAFARLGHAPADIFSLSPETPRELGQLVMGMLEKDPQTRADCLNELAKLNLSVPNKASELALAAHTLNPYNLSGINRAAGGGSVKSKLFTTVVALVFVVLLFMFWSKDTGTKAPPAPAAGLLERKEHDIIRANMADNPYDPLNTAENVGEESEVVRALKSAQEKDAAAQAAAPAQNAAADTTAVGMYTVASPAPEPGAAPSGQDAVAPQPASEAQPAPAAAAQEAAAAPQAPAQEEGGGKSLLSEQANENHLLKGQVLYLQKKNTKAIDEWKKIEAASRFYGEAQENIAEALAAQAKKKKK